MRAATVLLTQARQSLRKHRPGPASIVKHVRTGQVGRFKLISLLAILVFERFQSSAATAFERFPSPIFIDQVVLQSREQEGAEPAALAIGQGQCALLEKVRQECLCQVLGVLRLVSGPPDVSIKRVPVSSAEGLQGFCLLAAQWTTGCHDHAPMGRDELCTRISARGIFGHDDNLHVIFNPAKPHLSRGVFG